MILKKSRKRLNKIFSNSNKKCIFCNLKSCNKKEICQSCKEELSQIKEPCNICSLDNTKMSFCSNCLAKKPAYDQAFVAYNYQDPISHVLTDLKFNDKPYFAKPLVELFNIQMQEKLRDIDFDYICPVPMHRKKNLQRGFNQAELLAKYFYKSNKKNIKNNILEKNKETKSQSELSKKERLKNTIGCFKIQKRHQAIIKNKTIAIFDDVITTGSTVNELAKVLKKNGVKNVVVFAIART